MAGNFQVWWDDNMPRLRWSGRSELEANPIGPHFPDATRNHIVSHSMAMRMLINRINEAYIQQNHFSLKQNIDLILAGTCIMIVNLPANCDVMIARNAILNNWLTKTDPLYQRIEDVPEYLRAEARSLIEQNALRGENGQLNIRHSQLRTMIVAKRYADALLSGKSEV